MSDGSAAARAGPEHVHAFWFGAVDDWAAVVERNYARWFERGHELDAELRNRFGELVVAAGRGACDGWAATARGALALVMVLDQFPRHIHRGSARAFEHDAHALRICVAGVDAGLDEGLSAVEQSFFYLPLQHAEDPQAQARSVALLTRRARECAPAVRGYLDQCLRYATLHRDLIERFGRFPHRNAALGRESSAEERAYLSQGGARFGQ